MRSNHDGFFARVLNTSVMHGPAVMLRVHVRSLGELEEQYPQGRYLYSPMCETPEGKFVLVMYPCGKEGTAAGGGERHMSLYLRCLSVSKGNTRAVQVDASFRIVLEDGSVYLHRPFAHTAWLSLRYQENPR
jgi:hypothetical protein